MNPQIKRLQAQLQQSQQELFEANFADAPADILDVETWQRDQQSTITNFQTLVLSLKKRWSWSHLPRSRT
jgi:hypothetical protein